MQMLFSINIYYVYVLQLAESIDVEPEDKRGLWVLDLSTDSDTHG